MKTSWLLGFAVANVVFCGIELAHAPAVGKALWDASSWFFAGYFAAAALYKEMAAK